MICSHSRMYILRVLDVWRFSKRPQPSIKKRRLFSPRNGRGGQDASPPRHIGGDTIKSVFRQRSNALFQGNQTHATLVNRTGECSLPEGEKLTPSAKTERCCRAEEIEAQLEPQNIHEVLNHTHLEIITLSSRYRILRIPIRSRSMRLNPVIPDADRQPQGVKEDTG